MSVKHRPKWVQIIYKMSASKVSGVERINETRDTERERERRSRKREGARTNNFDACVVNNQSTKNYVNTSNQWKTNTKIYTFEFYEIFKISFVHVLGTKHDIFTYDKHLFPIDYYLQFGMSFVSWSDIVFSKFNVITQRF